MNNKTNIIQCPSYEFSFSQSFLKSFNDMISSLDENMDKLTKGCNSFNCEYGICNHAYKMRYITPNDVSTYVSNLAKVFNNHLINMNVDDIEMFTVVSVKKIIEENDCAPFENTTVNAGAYINPGKYTLKDLLVLSANDIQGSEIYSTYELEKRCETLKTDVSKMTNLHFVANMKNIVKGLPRIINGMDGEIRYSKSMNNIFRMFIEEFILFACSLNNITIINMIDYCAPQQTYNFKQPEPDHGEYIECCGESVDVSSKSPVYVSFFSRVAHPSLFEKVIRKVTNSKYSHVSISFDPHLKEMYSYTGPSEIDDNDARLALKKETIFENRFDKDEICVYCLYIDNDAVLKMEESIKDAISKKTKYDVGSCIKKLLGLDRLSRPSLTKSICSTFVQQLLTNATNRSVTNKNIPSPSDILISFKYQPECCFEVYNGIVNDYNVDKVINKQNKIVKKKNTHAFDEVVTECCLLKTSEFTVRNRIPFDCNMRNVVLCDTNPDFVDTEAALDFIIKDSRSPICILLGKYLPDNYRHDSGDVCAVSNLLVNMHNCDRRFNDEELSCHHTKNTFFNTDLSWLNNIVYGNSFSDCNYRRDGVGNIHTHPITNTMDMIYKMFNPCSITTNEDLSVNIMRVYDTMKCLIMDNRIEYNIGKEILVLLGEIFTRSILKLYHNNTTVISAGTECYCNKCYFQLESFVLEGGTAQSNPAPTPAPTANSNPAPASNPTPNNNGTNNGSQPAPQVSVNNTNVSKIKQKTSEIINKFKQWTIQQLSKFADKFNQDHKMEVTWIKNNSVLNNRISEAIGNGQYSPTVTNMPKFDIPAQDIINNIKVNEIVNKWLNSTETIDPVKIKKELYPGGDAIAGQIASMKTETGEINALSNYILYKQITPKAGYSGKLKKEDWDGLIKDLTETGNLIENTTKKISGELKTACETLQSKIRQSEVNKNTNKTDDTNNNPDNSGSRADQLFTIVQSVSKTYYVTMLNTLRSKFYAINYKLYRDLVTAYNQQSTNNNNQLNQNGQPNQTNQSGQSNQTKQQQ